MTEQQRPYLPETGFIRIKQVLELMGFKKSKWYRGVKSGEFPAPVHHGHAALYPVESIRELIRKIGAGNA